MKKIYDEFNLLLKSEYPGFSNQFNDFNWSHLVSNKSISLPKTVFDQAQNSINALFEVSRTNQYKSITNLEESFPFFRKIKNYSLLMAYDFHLDENNNLKLIEVNTNASGYLISDLIYKAHNLSQNPKPIENLKNSFFHEFSLYHLENPDIYIVDEDILSQKMNFEFHMYQELFKSWGLESYITDYKDLFWDESKNHLLSKDNKIVEFIYNRYCDFLLADKSSVNLNSAFASGKVCFSPNPIEYSLLADKNRLIELSRENWLKEEIRCKPEVIQQISNVLISTRTLDSFGDREELWRKRKGLFFKPKRSHGGKATYRGKSITKKIFATLSNENFLAQKLTPPKEIEFADGTWKSDLRFFVYKNEIQLSVARLYKGQVTNFSHPNGGFTPINFK